MRRPDPARGGPRAGARIVPRERKGLTPSGPGVSRTREEKADGRAGAKAKNLERKPRKPHIPSGPNHKPLAPAQPPAFAQCNATRKQSRVASRRPSLGTLSVDVGPSALDRALPVRRLDCDLARLRLLGNWHLQGEHAIVVAGRDLVQIHVVAQDQLAAEDPA